MTTPEALLPQLAQAAQRARQEYLSRLSDPGCNIPWWTTVIITASSERQAARYREEIQRRREAGTVPGGVLYLVVPDIDDQRIGSGGATLHALHTLATVLLPTNNAASLESWWAGQRVLILHCGGDSRRLPQYSLSGKLFSALPVKTVWDEVSTVFDEMLALSTAWARQMPDGLLVSSGDVILTFDAEDLQWDRPGVAGVAMAQPPEVGAQHGVYALDSQGRVYAFLQKPSAAEVQATGGFLADGQVAVDTGLLRFDASTAALLTDLAGVNRNADTWRFGPGLQSRQPEGLPVIDLYQHITLALTGQWQPAPEAPSTFHRLKAALQDIPFYCSLVHGDFTHIGTTTLFRQIMTEQTSFRQLYAAQQQIGLVHQADVESGGVIVESVLAAGSVLGPGSMAIECCLDAPLTAGRGSILHGLTDLPASAAIEIPDEVVVHQIPVLLPDHRRGVITRVYGVADDPRATTWLGRPLDAVLAGLAIDPAEVWPHIPERERTLWNALLFPVATSATEAWACVRWFLGLGNDFDAARWRQLPRLSLASSAQCADAEALSAARARRLQTGWQKTVLSLAESGTDLTPLLSYAPGPQALANAGRSLLASAQSIAAPTEAASRYFQASRFLGQAGLVSAAEDARAQAFRQVQAGVEQGMPASLFDDRPIRFVRDHVRVAAPVRIDLGGGWSDTPPFCLDWGGTVLNIAITLNGEYPIRAEVRRLSDPVIRCLTVGTNDVAVYRAESEITAPCGPGDPFSLVRVALQMAGLTDPTQHGLEVRTHVDLPVGSGLGTSSILAAAVLQALAELRGIALTPADLNSQVMRLEQLLTTGGGWQDQAGGIFPGAKLLLSGPGLTQKIRVQPVEWTPERRQEFRGRFVLYYTGLQRIAKNLLAQVVGSYLAREVATVQVLHSIKTLALEMSYALQEGEWDHLGHLLDRHWQLNQILDPHTTNAPINALLRELRPYLAGVKLAGAGGGGFLMMLARSPEHAASLRERLRADASLPGALYEFAIANEGLQITAGAAQG